MSRKSSLVAIGHELLEEAGRNQARRASRTVIGGHERTMRQTVVSLAGGATLAEHESPGEATVYVIAGRVEVTAGDDSWEASPGDLIEIPDERHALHALEESSVLLTAVPRGFQRSSA